MQLGYKYKDDCYSLKKNVLLKWMYKNGYSRSYMARRLWLTKEEFMWRLHSWEPFDKYQITQLVKIMGARDTFFAIYFHSGEQRKEVYRQVFGKELVNRHNRIVKKRGGESN